MSQGARIYDLLIVDDDAVDRQHYGKLLRQHAPDACEICEAEDGAAGLKALAARTPDCVVLDYRLPDMTGLEFLADAAIDGELPCAVVVLTGQGDTTIAVEAMKHGVQDYLSKDELDGGRLWRAVTHAVTQAEMRRRLADTLARLAASYAALEPANAALDQAVAALENEVAVRKGAEGALRAARDAAEAANHAKTRFLAMTTRELCAPVNEVLGQAGHLRAEGGLSDRQEGRLRAMVQAGQHMLELADGVLEFASIDVGRTVLHPHSIAVRGLVEGCIGAVAGMAGDQGLRLRMVDADDAPREIFADRTALRQALVNLLGNRLKYSGASGLEVRILPGDKPGGLRIEVADIAAAGDGARPEQALVDFREPEAEALGGAGIGLAIAAKLVGLMGGTMGHGAHAEHGADSAFWLEVPSAEGEAVAKPVRGRVLLVDDIEMNRDVIGGFLRAAGHEVLLAESGRDAVRMAFQKMVDVVLMDVRMPEMDGLEATRRIRALPNPGSEVPILALSAYTMRNQAAQCLEAGMDGFVSKPVGYATLMRAIEDVFLRPTVVKRGLPKVS